MSRDVAWRSSRLGSSARTDAASASKTRVVILGGVSRESVCDAVAENLSPLQLLSGIWSSQRFLLLHFLLLLGYHLVLLRACMMHVCS